MSQYTSYEKFFNPEQAQPVMTILKENNIPYEFIPIKQVVDQVLVGGGPAYSHELKIPASQFKAANQVLRENIQVEPEEVDPDYYLFAFDDRELIEILKQPDEWGRLDYALARKILESRGIVYTAEELESLWNKRMQILAKPEKEEKGWIYAGYFFAVFGGFFGVLIGLALMQSTKTLPDGRKVYAYDEATRKKAKRIFIVSMIVFLLVVLGKVTRVFEFITNIPLYERPVIHMD